MTAENFSELAQRQTIRVKRWSIFFTVIYCILFVPFLGIAYFSPFVFDSPNITASRGLTTIFLAWLIPLSIPIGIFQIWSNYAKRRYQWTRFFWTLPILAVATFCMIEALLDFFTPYH